MTSLSSFNVSDILLKIAEQDGINLSVENIDDTALGCLITSDKSFNAFLSQHALPYNYLIVDGDPIRVVRRTYGDAGGVDLTVNQSECVVRDGPALRWSRVDPFTLPRQVEIQYTDPDRDFATNTQTAHYPGAPTSTPGISIALDYVVTAAQARALAFDTLYRIWAQIISVTFEHPNLGIEPADVLQLVTDDGTFTMLVIEATLTVSRTNEVTCTLLGSQTMTTADGIAGGTANPSAAYGSAKGQITLTDTSVGELFSAPAGSPDVSLRNYVAAMQATNTGGSDVTISIYDGSATSPDAALATLFVPAGQTVTQTFPSLLYGSVGNAINVAGDASSTVVVSAQGFTST